MPALFVRQSELSVASALFYAAGGTIALASFTVFRDDRNPLNLASLVVCLLAFALAATFLLLGRKMPVGVALVLLSAAAVQVLLLVVFSQNETRSMGSGLLFNTFLLYLVWFGPMWYARVFGYSWLAIYCAAMLLKFSPEARPYLLSLALTSLLLGELIGTYKRRLETSTLTDPLCAIWNKRGLGIMVERSIQDLKRSAKPSSVLFCDLDDFKRINDEFGHTEGDRVLREFARHFYSLTRPQDVLARIGGDEFALLMPETTLQQAFSAAERLHAEMTHCSWSYGAAELEPGESAEEFLARADALMFEHKRQRKTASGPR